MTKRTRKIGLGVMGWADLLFQLGIPYDSEEALRLGERMMAFIQEKADAASEGLAQERGVFPAWEGSVYAAKGRRRRLRNSTRTTVAPTGTLSHHRRLLRRHRAGLRAGVHAAALPRSQAPGEDVQLTEVNKHFERAAKEGGFHSQELLERAGSRAAAFKPRPTVPEGAKRLFVTAHDVVAGVARAHAGGVPAAHGQRRQQDDQLPPRRDAGGRGEGVPAGLSRGVQGDHDLSRPVAGDAGALARHRARAGAGGGGRGRAVAGTGGGAGAATGRALPAASARRTGVDHAQVPGGRPGGLRDGRAVRGRQHRARCS